MRNHKYRSIVPGIGVIALGVAALGIAVAQFALFADTPVAGAGQRLLLGMSPGTAAYVLGYGGAGIVLIGLGIVKIHRARHDR